MMILEIIIILLLVFIIILLLQNKKENISFVTAPNDFSDSTYVDTGLGTLFE